MTPFITQRIDTPIGPMRAIASEAGLVLCEYDDPKRLPAQLQRMRALFGVDVVPGEHPFLDQTRRELSEYFAATRESFSVPLVLDGTPFQTSVWRALLAIPFGSTTSYDQLATRIGRPGAARAVGRANGDNRMAIIVPCHRVINASGTLAGYGGGLRRKKWLLAHESRGVQLSLIDERPHDFQDEPR